MSSDDFPKRLKDTREAKGLGVNELNRVAKLSGGTVTRLEFGDRKTVGAAVVDQLADALGVRMDWLWKGQAEPGIKGLAGPAATFVMALLRRKLLEVIERDPARWKLETVIRAVELDVPVDDKGVPIGGWVKLLDNVEAGRTTERTAAPSTRKRRPARKR